MYKENKIKRKKIKLTKNMNYNARRRFKRSLNTAREELKRYMMLGYRIIYCDETMITKSTIPAREFRFSYKRVEIMQQSLNDDPIAVLVGVSKECGIDLVMTFENSVNKEKFKQFASKLRQKYPFYRICLYLDNLSVHRSLEVRQHLERL